MMAHKGIREYSGEESGNVALGQLGFKVLTGSTNTGDGNFVAFKVIGGAATLTAAITTTVHIGDALVITALTGEIIWGPFKRITVGAVGSGVKVLCYYGRDL